MANISITSECNRSCPYCFAGDAYATGVARMTREQFRNALAFAQRSGLECVRLLGGEPTLHPDFVWFVEEALARGLRVVVFSNGLMPAAVRRSLTQVPPESLSITLNVPHPSARTAREDTALAALADLAPRVRLGFNIQSPQDEPSFLIPLVLRYRFDRTVRIGMTHPTLSGKNGYLAFRDLRRVGAMLAAFGRQALESGLSPELDCGFVPCMFPPGGLQAFEGGPTAGQSCGPIPDLLPNDTLIPCYPLASLLALPVGSQDNADACRAVMNERLAHFRRLGMLPICTVCDWQRAGECNGGCLARAIWRLRPSRDARRWAVA